MKQAMASGASRMTRLISFMVTSKMPCTTSCSLLAAGVFTSSRPMPKNRAKNITARMSFAAAAPTTLVGMRARKAATPCGRSAWPEMIAPAPSRELASIWSAHRPVHPLTRLDEVGDRERDDHCYRREKNGEEQRLEPDSLQRPHVAHLGDADDERREEQGNDQHEEEAEEDLPAGARDIVADVFRPNRAFGCVQ